MTAKRGVAGVLAALLLALITVSSLVTVLTLTSKSLEYSRVAMEGAAKRARDMAIPPALSLEVRGRSLVATVISQDQVEIKWFIVEWPDGNIEVKPGGKVQIIARFTLSTNYDCQPVRVYMLLSSGATVAYDPRNDPLIARMPEGWDGWWKCNTRTNPVTAPMNLYTTALSNSPETAPVNPAPIVDPPIIWDEPPVIREPPEEDTGNEPPIVEPPEEDPPVIRDPPIICPPWDPPIKLPIIWEPPIIWDEPPTTCPPWDPPIIWEPPPPIIWDPPEEDTSYEEAPGTDDSSHVRSDPDLGEEPVPIEPQPGEEVPSTDESGHEEVPGTNDSSDVRSEEDTSHEEVPGTNEEVPGTNEEAPGTNEEAPSANDEAPGANEEAPGTDDSSDDRSAPDLPEEPPARSRFPPIEPQPPREEHYADYPDYADYSIADYFILVDPPRVWIRIGDPIDPPPPPRPEHFTIIEIDHFADLLPDIYPI